MEIEDYVERMGYYPSYKQPTFLSKDDEFAYYEFRIPHAYRNDTVEDPSGVLPDGWMYNMRQFLVHTGIELVNEDATFLYFKCKVPLVILNSPYGHNYHVAVNVHTFSEGPSPEQEKKILDVFEKAKQQEVEELQQYEITFICERCKQEETEIHNNPVSGLWQRRCGNCHFTVLKLATYKPLWPQVKLE